MSFAARGPGVGAITSAAIATELPPETEWEPSLDAVPLPPLSLLYLPGISTRAVELSRAGDHVAVRILVCSSIEDHELAIATIGAVARLAGIFEIEAEQDGAVPVEELAVSYGRSWIADEIAFGAATVVRVAAERPDRVVSLPGPVRPTVIGSRVAGELAAAGQVSVGDRLVGVMRRTQWPGDAYLPSVIEIGNGERVRLTVLSASRTVLPDVDGIVLPDGATQLYLQPEAIVRLVPGSATYLDERHILVEAMDADRREALLVAARAVAVPLESLSIGRASSVQTN